MQRDFTDIERQTDNELTEELSKRQLWRMPNWKSPGPDCQQLFCADNSHLNKRKNFIAAECVMFLEIKLGSRAQRILFRRARCTVTKQFVTP